MAARTLPWHSLAARWASASRLADADEIDGERLGEAARDGDADAQAGEGAGSEADGDALEGIPSDVGLCEQLLGEWQQTRGVPGPLPWLRIVAGAERGAVSQAQPDGGGRRGSVEAEHDHATCSAVSRRSAITRRTPWC